VLEIARQRLEHFADRVRFFHSPFSRLQQVVEEAGLDRVDRVLMDLGLSSFALDDPERGFAFMTPGRLDMRMDRSTGEDAAALVARLPQRELAELIATYGEERFSGRIARAIVEARKRTPIETTTGLAEIVARAVPRSGRYRIHPATRTFQALRIAVNRELDQLGEGLEAVAKVLGAGGRVAVISFHSLEDRLVKRFFKERLEPLHKKVIRPGPAEVQRNRRARSARLRVAAAPGGGVA
jgi:16S rRNA (cytosine1402-N4)-methyltransferase